MTTDSTPLTAEERATMRTRNGRHVAELEAASRARITRWQERMAPVRARLVESKATLLKLGEEHRDEVAGALADVRGLTDDRLDYKSAPVLRMFRQIDLLGIFNDNPKAMQRLIDRIDTVTDADVEQKNLAPQLTEQTHLLCGTVRGVPPQLADFRRHYRALMAATWKKPSVHHLTMPGIAALEAARRTQFARSKAAQPRGAND